MWLWKDKRKVRYQFIDSYLLIRSTRYQNKIYTRFAWKTDSQRLAIVFLAIVIVFRYWGKASVISMCIFCGWIIYKFWDYFSMRHVNLHVYACISSYYVGYRTFTIYNFHLIIVVVWWRGTYTCSHCSIWLPDITKYSGLYKVHFGTA